jgi:uncharacterized protein (DUF983 family)
MILDIAKSIAGNKCPRCHKGKVFENNNPYSFKNGLTMKDSCSACDLKYEREPGFFYGSMYVSYALMSGILIVWFLVDLIWVNTDAAILMTIIIVNMLVLFPIIFRWSRLIWLNFFFKFDKKYERNSSQKIISTT